MGILAYGKKCASWLQLSAHFSNVIFELIAATRGICYAPLRLKPTLNGIKLLSDTPPDILIQVIIPYSQIKSYFLGGLTWDDHLELLGLLSTSLSANLFILIFALGTFRYFNFLILSTLVPDIIIFVFSKNMQNKTDSSTKLKSWFLNYLEKCIMSSSCII